MLSDEQTQRLAGGLAEAVPEGAPLTLDVEARLADAAGVERRAVQSFALRRGIVPERYSRNVAALGLDGQRRLLDSDVLVVGLGGLGGHVLETLGRLGVGRIAGADGDVIAESNLNRQLLADVEGLGRTKVDQARRRLARINPAVTFTGYACSFEQLGPEAWRGIDLVFDCVDSIPARRRLAERCDGAGLTLVHGAIAGWAGQVALCPPGGGMIERIYAGPKRGQEERLGNLPFTAAVAANLMVAKAVPLLLGQAPAAPASRLVFFDLLGGDWETIDL